MRPECLPTSNHMIELNSMFEKFRGNKDVNNVIKNPDEVFGNMVYSEFKKPLETLLFSKELTKGDLKGLQDRLDNLVKSAKDGTFSNKFASLMYTPESFGRKEPIVTKLIDEYIKTSHYYKGNQRNDDDFQTKILGSLKKEMKTLGYMDSSISTLGKRLTFKDASSQINKLEKEIQRELVASKNGDKEAQGRLKSLLKDEVNLYQNSELEVYAQFGGYIENGLTQVIQNKLKANPNLKWDVQKRRKGDDKYFFNRNDFRVLRDKDDNKLSDNMINALYDYSVFSDNLYWTLNKGIDKYIDTVLHGQTGKTADQIKELRTTLRDKLMPNMKEGYFPHFTRDLSEDFLDGLMGRLDDMVLASNKYIKKNMTLQEAIDNISGYITGHAKSQKTDAEHQSYSHNIPQVLSRYSQNVNRFNYINSINSNTANILGEIEKMYKLGKDGNGYGDEVVHFVNDLHKAATGYDSIKNPALNNLLRSVTGFEFISKIGFNPRSAIRNMSQSMLNFVQFSPIQLKEYRDFYSTTQGRDLIDKTMQKRGLLFADTAPELTEVLGTNPSLASSVRYNPNTRKLEFVESSKLAKASGAISTIAGKAGIMMAKVENYNRKLTFGIGYSKMYKELDNVDYYSMKKKQLIAKSKEAPSEKAIKSYVESQRRLAAENYASNMTVALHFDYNAYSKAKGLRTKTGQIVGQFQHYAFKFFERNMEYLRKGKNDAISGDLNGHNLWRSVRLGLAYFGAPMLATSLSGVEFGNILEHDSFEKIKKLAIGLTGDEEEAQKAFYGKGPIIGSIGFPVYSDLVNIGMMLDVINMDDDSMLTYLAGLKDSNEKYNDDMLARTIQLLNPAVNRAVFRHLPQLQRGNIGWVMQSELGLYPTKEAKEQQEKFKQNTSPELFELIEELQKRGR